jgi:ribosomal protein S18 acetylase RimI-like enzyme
MTDERARIRPFKEVESEFALRYRETFDAMFGNGEMEPHPEDLFIEHMVGEEPRAWILVRHTKGEWYIAWGGVLPKYRGLGGRYFLHALDVMAQMDRGFVRLITKQANKQMQILALKLGFEITGAIVGRDGKFEVVFSRRL